MDKYQDNRLLIKLFFCHIIVYNKMQKNEQNVERVKTYVQSIRIPENSVDLLAVYF